MGKKGQSWGSNAWKDGSGYGYYSWSQDWKSQQQADRNPGNRPRGVKNNVLPAYNEVVLVDEEPGGGDATSALTPVQQVQKALNAARKASGRCKKLTVDLDNRRQKWAKYEADVKRSFLQQHHQFQQDVQRLQKEIQDAQTQAELAAEKVRTAALQEQHMEDFTQVKDEAIIEDAWDKLLARDTDEEHFEDSDVANYLQKLLNKGGRQHGLTTTASRGELPGTGTSSTAAPPVLPPKSAAPSRTTLDPYVGFPATLLGPPAAGPPPYGPSPSRRSPQVNEPYVKIRDAGKDAAVSSAPSAEATLPVTPVRRAVSAGRRLPAATLDDKGHVAKIPRLESTEETDKVLCPHISLVNDDSDLDDAGEGAKLGLGVME